MLEKIQAMLAEALNLPLEKVTPDAKIVDDLGADSLDVVELLSQLEEEYGIIIPDDQAESLATVSDVANVIDALMK
jgi:acyl carrier protein